MILTTAEIALGAPAIAVAGTLLGAWIQSRRDERRTQAEREQERLRWQREDAVSQLRVQQEYTAKWADERRMAYRTFFFATEKPLVELASLYRNLDEIATGAKSTAVPDELDCEDISDNLASASADLELLAENSTREKAMQVASELREACARANHSRYTVLRAEETGDIDQTATLYARATLDVLGGSINQAKELRNEFRTLAQADIGTLRK